MATGFTPQDCSCSRCHRQDHPHITYRVEMDQQLCDNCAQEMQGFIMPVRRKVWWFCEKHPEKEAEVFCETHQAAICHICAITKTHRPCDMKDIHDEIDERKRCLLDQVAKGKTKGKEIIECELTVARRSRVVEQNLEKLHHEINEAFDKEMKKLNDEKEKTAAKITMEAKDGIAKLTEQINKNRFERLHENEEDSKRTIAKIEDKRGALNRDLEHVKQKFEHESDIQKTKCQTASKALDEALMKAEKLVNEENNLLTEFTRAMQSLHQDLETEVNVENVINISTIVEKIVFRRENELAVGILGVPSNEWKKEDEFQLEPAIFPLVIQSDKNAVVFRSCLNGAIYVKNIRDKTTLKVVANANPYDIRNCKTLDDGRIVCGTLKAEIVIYNPTWKHLRTIVLTKEEKGKATLVTTDRDGMIVAVVSDSAVIYIYNPDDGVLVRSVSFHVGPVYGIGCLSSGDMVVSTNCSQGQDMCVVDGSGVVKYTTHFRGKILGCITVDKLTDLIYVMYYVGSECAVDVHVTKRVSDS